MTPLGFDRTAVFGCAELQARLIDIGTGQLDSTTGAQAAAHLADCASCQEKVALWQVGIPAMRALVPAPPSDLCARRLELDILRQLQSDPGEGRSLSADGRRVRKAARWALSLSAVAAAVVVLAVSLHHGSRGRVIPAAVDRPAYATVVRVEGDSTSGGRRLTAASRLNAGNEIEVAAESEAELLMDRGSVLRLFGPARLKLGGSPEAVALQLEEGTLQADVLHRVPGETFAVITRDLRVAVRGTRFIVGTGAGGGSTTGGWVRVQQGLVAVRFLDGRRRLVGEGEMAAARDPVGLAGLAGRPSDSTVDQRADESADQAGGASSAPRTGDSGPRPSCGMVLHACQIASRGARDSMRVGHHQRALRAVAAASRSVRETDAECGAETSDCQDELRYLRAEALRGAGRIDDAVSAYQALNRPGAPAAMRQNAAYAAAELERRAGRLRAALIDYERALAVESRGALHEEALVGAMETADALRDKHRSGTLAHRYLAEFPTGRAARNARRLAQLADDEQRH